MRALLIIGAAAVLAWRWGIDTHILGKEDTLFARLVHGALSAVIIFLVADLMWQAAKTAIDRKLAEAEDLGQPNTDEARRRARLRTLLPIFRNILFVVVIAVGKSDREGTFAGTRGNDKVAPMAAPVPPPIRPDRTRDPCWVSDHREDSITQFQPDLLDQLSGDVPNRVQCAVRRAKAAVHPRADHNTAATRLPRST